MILNWMLATVIFGFMLAGAAMLGERAAAAIGKPRRQAWGLGLAAATLWPLAAGILALVSPAEPSIVRITTRISSVEPAPLAVRLPVGASFGDLIESALLIAWIGASVTIALRIAVAVVRMRRLTRMSEPMTLDGTPVLVSEVAGPAVSGFWTPRIIVPRWLLDLDAPLRAVVLRHESEHLARGDSMVMLGAATTTVLMPWNPAVWWMSRRLRLAVELDCDARVLAARENPDRYGRLLMLVAQRQAHARLAPMLAESNADLEWRIGTMNRPKTQPSPARAIILGGVAGALAILAFTSPAMAGVRAPTAMVRPLTQSSIVRQQPAVAMPARLQQGQGRQSTKQAANPQQEAAAVLKARDTVQRRQAVAGSLESTVSRQAEEAQHTQRPRYPDILRSAGVEGIVVAQFVVNVDGTADTSSLKVVRSSHALFQAAVRTALPHMQYTPAMVKGRVVRQLIEQTFEFRIADSRPAVEMIGADSALLSPVHKVNKVVITASKPR